ncbi:ATP-binding protein [Mycoplasma zalophidermidis]|uniref:ATP-binding protein n=1 Tax=Mycoplasma zalophidermidis TaxID=398174 RepID=A0ABS6DSB8_9MOLU|nr:ATP-binding protein [Mycoplasma zalophidermidis]MBU4693908.1 ATP-binding protein [Mycoplasma zalophidermidis]
MEVQRPRYLNQLIDKKDNGRVKIITGIRRCGKSYLLFELYRKYLLSSGVREDQIIMIALDSLKNIKYRNPIELDDYLRDKIQDDGLKHYIFIDEIQFVEEIYNPYLEGTDSKVNFVDLVLGLMKIPNVDVYITGSNSKMLSSDVLTQFRDRGDEIRVYPFSFAEFYSCYERDKGKAFDEFCLYGGMPMSVQLKSHEKKSEYLKNVFTSTYIKDVMERNKVLKDASIMDDLLDIISSSIGSLSNPTKLANTFMSEKNIKISQFTVSNYLDYFIDAFLIEKVRRYDVKGRKYISAPYKYYFSDIGLRNARLNFRQNEQSHIMENIIYNELRMRGLNVDVGVVEYNYKDENRKTIRKNLEVDFIINRGSNRYYIQSALNVDTREKQIQETESLRRTGDSFKKVVIVRNKIVPRFDNDGILYIGVEDFLLDETALDL